MPTRRHFLSATALAAASLPTALVSQGVSTQRVGAVIGPALRGSEVEAQLKALAGAGCAFAETSIVDLVKHQAQLMAVGIEPTSAFLLTPTVNGNWRLWRETGLARMPPEDYELDKALMDASRVRGLRNLTVLGLSPGERRNLDDYRRFADLMNAAGERCARAGLTLSYHAHSFELAMLEGRVPMELLIERFDSRYTKFEVDVFWMAIGGWDSVSFVRRHGDRITGLHLKDRSRAASTFVGELQDLPEGATVPLGQGNLDFRALLAQASASGVQYSYIEDESAGDRFQNLLLSLKYVRSIA